MEEGRAWLPPRMNPDRALLNRDSCDFARQHTAGVVHDRHQPPCSTSTGTAPFAGEHSLSLSCCLHSVIVVLYDVISVNI